MLSDEKRRRRYDNTGSLEEAEDGEFDWKSWFQEMWDGIVNGDTIREFKEKYQGESYPNPLFQRCLFECVLIGRE